MGDHLVTSIYRSQIIWQLDSLEENFSFEVFYLSGDYVEDLNSIDRYFAAYAMAHELVVIDSVERQIVINLELPIDSDRESIKDMVFHQDYCNVLVLVSDLGRIMFWNGVDNSIIQYSVEGYVWNYCFFAKSNLLITLDKLKRFVTWMVEL